MDENSSLFSLSIDPVTKTHLSEAAKWARILSIAGIVSLIIIIANSLYTTNGVLWMDESRESGKTDAAYSIGIILGIGLIMVIPLFALIFILRFSSAMKKALAADDQGMLNTSFQNLKIYFRYFGVITLIFLVLMALSFLLKVVARVS